MMKCRACGHYTLHARCPLCDKPTGPPGPARYSPEDPYGEYRRKLKRLAQGKGSP